jgi:protein-S-isoprenylcysteine O-methyltransferase Ste14
MPQSALTAVYIAGLVLAEALRLPARLDRARSNRTWHAPASPRRLSEILLVVAILIGMWVLPLLYTFRASWITSFDYTIPQWAAWPGLVLFALSILVHWRAQNDLSTSWSQTLELADSHLLVTTGVYSRIRHPIYASLILWAAAQPVLIQNLVAGWGSAIAVALIWLVRVPAEEKMMEEHFGAEYAEYASRTGRLIPKLRKRAA